MQAVVDGLVTHYSLSGRGKLVLFLHGWGDDSRTFVTLQTELAQKYQVLAVDLPGFGATQSPQTTWGLDEYARFIRAALEKLELGQPYGIIGHSNGGAVAIRSLSLRLVQPEKLILLAAAGIRDRDSMRRLFVQGAAKIGKVMTTGLPKRQRQALRKRLYRAAGSDMFVVPQLQETFKRTVRQDVQADAAQLQVSTLLVYGANDSAVPLRDGELYHRLIKGSRLEVLANTGHFVHHEQAGAVSELIRDFLR